MSGEREGEGEKGEDGTKVKQSKRKLRVAEEKQKANGGERRGMRGAPDRRKVQQSTTGEVEGKSTGLDE